MLWRPEPTDLSSDLYTDIMTDPDGTTHYGVLTILRNVAALGRPRGTLVRENGEPHNAKSLSRVTRIPEKLLEAVIPRLLKLGELENVTPKNRVKNRLARRDNATPRQDTATTEQDITEQDTTRQTGEETFSSPASPMMVPPAPCAEVVEPRKEIHLSVEHRQRAWFDQFWFLYWRKADKQTALATFRRHAITEAAAEQIIAAVKAHSPHYHLREVNFRPLAATWLNKRRYLEPFDESLPKIESRPLTRTESAQIAAEQRFIAKQQRRMQ